MRSFLAGLLVMVFSAASLSAQSSPVRAIHAGSLVDGTGAPPRRDRDRGAWSDRSGHTRVRNTCGGRSDRSLGLDPDAGFHRYAHAAFDLIVGLWLADWLLRR